MKREWILGRKDVLEKLDDLPVHTKPNNYCPKMDVIVLPKNFLLIILAAKCLVVIQARPPNSSGDICLLFYINPSSMGIIQRFISTNTTFWMYTVECRVSRCISNLHNEEMTYLGSALRGFKLIWTKHTVCAVLLFFYVYSLIFVVFVVHILSGVENEWHLFLLNGIKKSLGWIQVNL